MNKKEIQELIFLIVEKFSLEEIPRNELTTSLQELCIDSMDVIKIAAELEKQFSIKVPSSDLNSANFYSIKTITDFVNKKI